MLAKLERLSIHNNLFGEEGGEALAEAINTGDLPSLRELLTQPSQAIDGLHREHPRLKAACMKRGIQLS